MPKLNQLKLTCLKLNELIVYRDILHDSLIKKTYNLILEINQKEKEITELQNYYYAICHELIEIAEEENMKGDLWKEYLLNLITDIKNSFTLASENLSKNLSTSLKEAVIHDLNILKEIYRLNLNKIAYALNTKKINLINNYTPSQSNTYIHQQNYEQLKEDFAKKKSTKSLMKALIKYYSSTGAGKMNRHAAFRWNNENGLVGINNLNLITFDDLIGYESQKEKLIANTEAFLKGKEANNILLFGDSGTGKSSSIKALLNKYYKDKLRLIELTKYQMDQLPKILELLKDRGLYFIIFMDDLSFEDFETDYKYLKAIIEGGLEARPKNVLFYATSNRRHLIKEKWSERDEDQGEVHLSDAIQEKLSLVQRFGITIKYEAPNQKQYLEIVKELAKKHNLDIPTLELKEKAKQWALWNNGRSGRTAQQFINYLLGNVN